MDKLEIREVDDMRLRKDRLQGKQVRVRSKRKAAPALQPGGVPRTSYVPKVESQPGELLYRWDIINHIIKKFGYKHYLEIGVCGFDLEGNLQGGENLKRIQCEHKDGVDPAFFSEVSDIDGQFLWKMSSDKFFSKIGEECFYKEHAKWGAIFIDGEHIHEQVHRDFGNAAKHLAEGGTIFIHDAYPNQDYFANKHIIGGGRGSVWRVIAEIIFNNREWDVWTLKLDNSIAILRKKDVPGVFTEEEEEEEGLMDFTKFTWNEIQASIDSFVNVITLAEFREAF